MEPCFPGDGQTPPAHQKCEQTLCFAFTHSFCLSYRTAFALAHEISLFQPLSFLPIPPRGEQTSHQLCGAFFNQDTQKQADKKQILTCEAISRDWQRKGKKKTKDNLNRSESKETNMDCYTGATEMQRAGNEKKILHIFLIFFECSGNGLGHRCDSHWEAG